MGPALDVSPEEALLACVRIAAGEVAYCTTMVEALLPEDATIESVSERTRPLNLGKDGESASTTVKETTVGNEARLNIWIRTRQDALERLARFSKMALDAGVAERYVRAAERHGDILARVLSGVLGDLNLSEAQRARLPDLIHKHLTALEGSPADAVLSTAMG